MKTFKSLELKDQRFGYWTVLEMVGKTSAGKYIWKCQCKCGKFRDIVSSKIVKFNEFTCCANCTRLMKKNIKIENQPYIEKDGDIQAYISKVENRALGKNMYFSVDSNYIYNILEDQNRECYFSGLRISFKDHTASLDRLNPKFGYTKDNVVLVQKDINIMKALLLPDKFIGYCNNIASFNRIFPVFTRNITINIDTHFQGYFEVSQSYFYTLKYGAKYKKDNRLFEITIEDIWDQYIKQGGVCALSGLPIEFNPYFIRDGRKQTASVDRIDSAIGYTKSNIQIIHKDINWMKNVFNQDYFIETCKRVSRRHRQ